MTDLIMDTDFLIKVTNEPIPALKNFISDEGFTLSTLPSIRFELEGLARNKKPSTARRARLALDSIGSLVKEESLSEKPNGSTEADTILVDYARKNQEKVVVATLDGKLLSKLERMKVPYLTLRNDRPFFRTFSRVTYLTDKNR